MTDFNEIWNRFAASLHTDRARKLYRSVADEAVALSKVPDFLDLSARNMADGAAYFDRQAAEGKISPSYATLKKYALKAVSSAMERYADGYESPGRFIIVPDFPDNVTDVMSDDEVSSILMDAAEPQLRTILELMIRCALAPSEILAMRGSYLPIRTVPVYGRARRSVALPDDLVLPCDRAPSQPLFVSGWDNALSVRTLQRWLSKITDRTLTDIRTYSLIRMFSCGRDLADLRAYTGLVKGYTRYVTAAEAFCIKAPFEEYYYIPHVNC